MPYEPIKKVSIIISKGSLDAIYPGLILANGARMEGIEASLFFTFFGLDAIVESTMDHIKIATVGNPGMHIPTLLGALPGMSLVATKMMQRKMTKLDIPGVREFIEMIADAGCDIYACRATVDMFGLKNADFCKHVKDVITVGKFYELSAGASIIFT